MDTEPKKEHFFRDLIKFVIIAIVIVVPIRLFVAQPFIVSGSSMDPTFANNQYLVVDELSYHFRPVERGDVIIFKYPLDTTKYFIKRVIGLPGDTVEIDGSQVTIKNAAHPDGEVLTENYVAPANDSINHLTAVVPAGSYYVMGDNRAGSFDSRSWGTVPAGNIVGRPLIRLYPLDALAWLPGESQVVNR